MARSRSLPIAVVALLAALSTFANFAALSPADLLASPASAEPAAPSGSGGASNPAQWVVQPTPPVVGPSAMLDGIACTGPSHCVAVGGWGESASENALIEVWDGTTWALQAPAALRPGIEVSLASVSCVSESFCVAVGFGRRTSVRQTVVEQWDGTAWSLVPSPNLGSGFNILSGVDCASPTFCVAVGLAEGATDDVGLVITWDGTKWVSATTPSLGAEGNLFTGVSCPTITDCWIVGNRFDGPDEPLVEHWDGTAWSVETVPSPGPGTSLAAIDCADASTCVAVGERNLVDRTQAVSFRRLDGAWELLPGVTFGQDLSSFTGVSCADATHCVAVGRSMGVTVESVGPASGPVSDAGVSTGVSAAGIEPEYPPSIATWDGTAWTVIPDPAGGFASTYLGLVGVSCPSIVSCHTVGYVIGDSGFVPLALASVVPPTPTPEPAPEPLVPTFTG